MVTSFSLSSMKIPCSTSGFSTEEMRVLRVRALFMWVIWVSEVTLFVGHRLLHGRIGVANYPYLSKKQPMRY